jgi:hypothetical protein
MVTIILVIVGIFLLFKQTVSLSNTSELRRPSTVIMGVITIAAGVLAMVIGNRVDPNTQTDVLVYVGAFVIPLIAIPFLKQPKLSTTPADVKTGNKAVNVIGWVVLIAVVGFLVWLMTNIQ